MTPASAQLAAARALVSARLGLAVPDRLTRPLQIGLTAAARVLEEPDGAALCRQLDAGSWQGPVWQALIDCVTVRETTFLRQRDWWDAIVAAVLRPLVSARRADGTRRLTLLSVGCATGEEPYSLALLVDRLLGDEPGWQVTITGVDLCTAALAKARAGRFDARAVRELSPNERDHWFRRDPDGHFRLDPRLRERVSFHPVNLVALADGSDRQPMPGAPADFVICRNVLIHLTPARQIEVARFLTGLLRPEGRLAVAPVEATAAWFAPLQFESHGAAILFASRPVPAGRSPISRPVPSDLAAPAVRTDGEAFAADVAAPATARPLPREAPASDDDDVRLEQARRLADRGLFAEARRLCGEALAGSAEADLLMALVCQALGDLPAARQAVSRALAATPEDPAAHYVQAILWLRAGRTDRARGALERAVGLLNAGAVHQRLGGALAIEADQIRQAARRLGIADGGAHVVRS